MNGRGPNSILVGQVAGLVFCIYVKLFLPSNFNSVDFLGSMSCIVLDIELADINVFQELGVYFDGKVQGYSSRPPKKHKPTKQAFWCTRKMHRSLWNSGCLNCTELPKFLYRDVKGRSFAKGREKCITLRNFPGQEVENWDARGCPNLLDILLTLKQVEKIGFARGIHSDQRPHFTLQNARQNFFVTGRCRI